MGGSPAGGKYRSHGHPGERQAEDKLEVPKDISREELEKQALASAKVKTFLDGVTVRKVIVVPGRLVNIVAN